MSRVTPRYSTQELAERGEAIYAQDIEPVLSPDDDGKLVAIDIETREYELGTDELAIADELRGRVPGAQIWLRRVGSKFLHRFGIRQQPTGGSVS